MSFLGVIRSERSRRTGVERALYGREGRQDQVNLSVSQTLEQPDGADSWSFTNWTSPVSGVETKAKTMPEPLKSALSIGGVEDTSLAVPSDDRELRSAQQRVLEQVHTIKRSKSKYSSKSVSGLPSPTSECTSADNISMLLFFLVIWDYMVFIFFGFLKAFHGITIFFLWYFMVKLLYFLQFTLTR